MDLIVDSDGGGVNRLMPAARLRVRVDGENFHLRYFPFFRRDIPLADIAHHWEARTSNPIAE
jgi:hypothetical protein